MGSHSKTLATGSKRAYSAVIVHALYRRKKIGPVNHFEEEQVLWKITNKGDVPFARKILASHSEKHQDQNKSDRLILYKDGRSDGGRVYFLNPSLVEDLKKLCKEFDLTIG